MARTRATAVAMIRRMPPEDCLWAKSWKGRTIFSTGRCSRATLMPLLVFGRISKIVAYIYSPIRPEARSRRLLLKYPKRL